MMQEIAPMRKCRNYLSEFGILSLAALRLSLLRLQVQTGEMGKTAFNHNPLYLCSSSLLPRENGG